MRGGRKSNVPIVWPPHAAQGPLRLPHGAVGRAVGPGGDQPWPRSKRLVTPEGELATYSTSVARLQEALKDKKFYRGSIDGIYGAQTQQAVMAFRKEIGASRHSPGAIRTGRSR